jgi:hypothetical protein
LIFLYPKGIETTVDSFDNNEMSRHETDSHFPRALYGFNAKWVNVEPPRGFHTSDPTRRAHRTANAHDSFTLVASLHVADVRAAAVGAVAEHALRLYNAAAALEGKTAVPAPPAPLQ